MVDKLLIIGLGNPGKKYSDTRHNIGYRVLNRYAEKNNCSFKKSKFLALTIDLTIHNQSVILAKPTTYMNNSGQAVREMMDFFRIETTDILVVYDDADLPLGKVRLRPQGGSAGHNGMASIIRHLNSQQFPRLRCGISSDFGRDEMVNFVLSPFYKQEKEIVDQMIESATAGINAFISNPIDVAMNEINSSS